MWYWGGGMQWWGWLLGAAGTVVFWGVVVWVIWYFATNVVRRPGPEGSPEGNPEGRNDDPKRILDGRLARGEIDAEEYRRLRDLMNGQTDRPAGGGERAGAARS